MKFFTIASADHPFGGSIFTPEGKALGDIISFPIDSENEEEYVKSVLRNALAVALKARNADIDMPTLSAYLKKHSLINE